MASNEDKKLIVKKDHLRFICPLFSARLMKEVSFFFFLEYDILVWLPPTNEPVAFLSCFPFKTFKIKKLTLEC